MEKAEDNKTNLFLDCLTLENVEVAREWRNNNIESLRTTYFLNDSMQKDFYEKIISDRASQHRYFGIFKPYSSKYQNKIFIGIGGVTYIQWENGLGEISLILDGQHAGKGYGKESVKLLLDKAFNEMRLYTIYGECYKCNKSIGFWEKIIKLYDGYKTILPNRKFYNGEYYDSLYFSFSKIDS
jgi:RimJ/RimL family protein N-acetyltransferase